MNRDGLHSVPEHDGEPVPGLPARLPPGEAILWQGAPEWRMLARRAFHVGGVGVYFALLLAWSVAGAMSDGVSLARALLSALPVVPVGIAALAMLGGLAWLTSRTTVYTITNRRVVMRFGIALPISLNLPFRQIASAGLKIHADGSGDLPLALAAGQRMAYLVMWPHVRPWRARRAEPMLRSVPEAGHVAQILARALAAAADQPAQAAPAGKMVSLGATSLTAAAAA